MGQNKQQEIEVKFRIDKVEPLIKILKSTGAKYLGKVKQTDILKELLM